MLDRYGSMHWPHVLVGLGFLTLCVAIACDPTVAGEQGNAGGSNSSDTAVASTGAATTGAGASGSPSSGGSGLGGAGAASTAIDGSSGSSGAGSGGADDTATVGSVTTVTTTGGTMVDYDPIPIPDDCLTRYASLSGGRCELDLSCGERDVSTSCELTGGTWHCYCGEPEWDYTMTGVAAEDACPYMASVCMGTTAAEYGDSTCRWEYRDATETFCETDVVCTQSAAPDERVTVSRSGPRSAYCNPTESGLWSCNCYPGFNLILGYEGGGTALCLDIIHWCAGEGVVPEGTRSCTLTNPRVPELNRCIVDLQCSRPATINGQSVTLESERVPVRCSSAAGDGNWTCRCGSTAPDDVFHIETAGDACTEAASVCADALSM